MSGFNELISSEIKALEEKIARCPACKHFKKELETASKNDKTLVDGFMIQAKWRKHIGLDHLGLTHKQAPYFWLS